MHDSEYSDLSEDQLLLEIGSVITGKGMMPLPPSVLVSKAKQWVNENLTTIRSKICGNKKVHEALNADITAVLIATVDTAVGTAFIPVPAALISHYCVKIGIRRICKGTLP